MTPPPTIMGVPSQGRTWFLHRTLDLQKVILNTWYNSVWLQKYDRATAIIRKVRPEALPAFVDAFRVFHTRPDFEAKLLKRPFDDATLEEIRGVIKLLGPTDLELHEAKSFGRLVVHDHPFFTKMQQRTVSLVSEVVG